MMATASNSKAISLDNKAHTLSFNDDADYSIDFTSNKVMIKEVGGQNTNVATSDFLGVSHFDFSKAEHLNLSGISFNTADKTADHKFEPTVNVDNFLHDLIDQKGAAGAIDALTVNGNQADAFKLIWDYIDDHYSYYNPQINAVGVELGLKYADYLEHGGKPLTDVIVKFIPDGPDAGTNPDRVQSLHDNLLGNLDINSIVDKFFDGNHANGFANVPAGYPTDGSNGGSNGIANEALGQHLIDEVVSANLVGRPYYGGYEGTDQSASHNWDVSHGLLLV
jgi:hypothetical protein